MLRRLKGRCNSDLHALPTLLPIPSLDCHVIASSQHDTRGRVDGQTPDIVRMGLEGGYFLVGVVVEYAKLEIVRACDEPVLTGDEFDTPDWDL